ncbi:hypothetical protein KKF61_09060 [Patescibacteria group bacterium]|nr:hypothetical protein [Patescibacteria group bacterium]
MVAAAPWKTLDIPPHAKISVKHTPQHPAVLCHDFQIPYEILPHEDVLGGRLGVIGGARILPKSLIDRFELGILNVHPGCLKRNRGLSNIARALRDGISQKVCAHLIDDQIDAGMLIHEHVVPVAADDSIWDLSEKMMDAQTIALGGALHSVMYGYKGVPVDTTQGYEKPLTAEEEWQIIHEWEMR